MKLWSTGKTPYLAMLFLLHVISPGLYLHGAGLDANAQLLEAASNGDVHKVQQLLNQGADIEATDSGGNTALILAIHQGNKDAVTTLLKHGANIEAANQEGNTALIVAAYQGHKDIVTTLLAAGANREAANQDGDTALTAAAYKGHKDIVTTLLAAGANREATNQDGSTALIVAAYRGHKDIVTTLLEHGANIEAAHQDGDTALIAATYEGHEDIVTTLLAAGANREAVNQEGSTALTIAAYKGHKDIVTTLLAAGANREAANQDGDTALILAADRQHYEVVETLLSNGANPRAADSNNYTALMDASSAGDKKLIKLLFAYAPDAINAQNNNRETPLHFAAYNNQFDTMELLISLGADKKIKNQEHRDPFYFIKNRQKRSMIKKISKNETLIDQTRALNKIASTSLDPPVVEGDSPAASGRTQTSTTTDKPKKRKKKKKKKIVKRFGQLASTAHQAAGAAAQAVAYAFDPAAGREQITEAVRQQTEQQVLEFRRQKQQEQRARMLAQQKDQNIFERQTIFTFSSQLEEQRYTIRLFDATDYFAQNNYKSARHIQTIQYQPHLQKRLSLLQRALAQGVPVSLNYDASDQNIAATFHQRETFGDLREDINEALVGEKQDLFHLFSQDVDNYLYLGVYKEKSHGSGTKRALVRIPGEISYHRADNTYTVVGFFEYNFDIGADGNLVCNHRFFRPANPSDKNTELQDNLLVPFIAQHKDQLFDVNAEVPEHYQRFIDQAENGGSSSSS